VEIVGVIPARFASTRFPGKPLIPILGKALVERVYLRAKRCLCLSNLLVATDDERILSFCENAGIPAIMTSDKHRSGTDRVSEVAEKISADAYVNIQGDEPLVSSQALDLLIGEAINKKVKVATLAARLENDAHEVRDPNVVKVVCDAQGFALYFSRSAIPYPRYTEHATYLQHVGVYYFTREALMKFSAFQQSPLELAEGLEQLRFLENGVPVFVVVSDYRPISVDTPEDVAKVERVLRELKEEY